MEQQIADVVPAEWCEVRDGKMYLKLFSCASQTAIHEPASFRYVDHVAAI
jgi:hypothetical protein